MSSAGVSLGVGSILAIEHSGKMSPGFVFYFALSRTHSLPFKNFTQHVHTSQHTHQIAWWDTHPRAHPHPASPPDPSNMIILQYILLLRCRSLSSSMRAASQGPLVAEQKRCLQFANRVPDVFRTWCPVCKHGSRRFQNLVSSLQTGFQTLPEIGAHGSNRLSEIGAQFTHRVLDLGVQLQLEFLPFSFGS